MTAQDLPAQPAQYLVLALVVVLLVLVAFSLGGRREKFASRKAREVHQKASQLFASRGDDVPYGDYKKAVPGATAVQHFDVRALYRGGGLTPENVEQVL
jgi:hypothetical protein